MKKRVVVLLLALTLSQQVCVPLVSAEEPEEVTFVLDWTPNTNHVGIYVAQEKGFFEEAGLSVSIVQPPDDGAEVLVASGKAQFGVSFQESMLPAIVGEDAMPITACAAVLQHNTSGIISRAGEGMDNPAGLEGKKYATWELPVELATLQQVVEDDGGDFSAVELIPSTVTDEVSALESHQVDAIWIFYGWAGVACELAGLDTDYFSFMDINPVFDYYTPVLITNTIENPDEAAEILLEAAPELDPDLVKKSLEYLGPQFIADAPSWGYIDAERWNAFYSWITEKGEIIH